jgi:hypothetical protein
MRLKVKLWGKLKEGSEKNAGKFETFKIRHENSFKFPLQVFKFVIAAHASLAAVSFPPNLAPRTPNRTFILTSIFHLPPSPKLTSIAFDICFYLLNEINISD